MYSVCSLRYMLANSFCAFFSFRAFVFVGFFLLHLEAVFMSVRFSLSANVSHGTLDLVLSFVGMHFATASRCALTKFSYSSFGVRISVFFCSASNLFLNANTYLSLIFLLLRRTYYSWSKHNHTHIYARAHIHARTHKHSCPPVKN